MKWLGMADTIEEVFYFLLLIAAGSSFGFIMVAIFDRFT